MHRLFTDQLPVVDSVERIEVREQPVPTVAFDVEAGWVARANEEGLAVGTRIPLAAAQDPRTPGLIGTDSTGRRALVMSCRSPHGDPQLVLVDFVDETTTVVHAFDGPGWVVGGFARGTIVVCAQQLGAVPLFQIHARDRRIHVSHGFQSPCVPISITPDVIAVVLFLRPDEMTGTGDTSLCVIHLGTGAIAELAPVSGRRLRLADDGQTIVVADGDHEIHVRLATPRR